jgi:hypothetical protein
MLKYEHMADIQKTPQENNDGDVVFTVRTMKKDLELIRRGLPLRETLLKSSPAFAPKEAPRKLANPLQVHLSDEKPPKESAVPLHGADASAKPAAPQPLQAPLPPKKEPAYVSKTPGYTIPSTFPKASITTDQLPRKEVRPIETEIRPRAPIAPASTTVTPHGGRIVAESDIGTGFRFIAFFQKMFPTRSRLIIAALIVIAVAGTCTYALFAYYGKPLPGSKYVAGLLGSKTPVPSIFSPSPTENPPTPSPLEPSVTPETSSNPIPSVLPNRTAYLPISRLGRIILPSNATKVWLFDKLSGFATINQLPGDFTQAIVRKNSSDSPLETTEFFSFLGISPPNDLLSGLSGDLTIFFYSPKNSGSSSDNKTAAADIGFLIPLKGSVQDVTNALKKWEATLGGDFAPLALSRPWQPGPNMFFSSNVYQGTSIRFQNFPDPYLSIDYAVFEGSKPPLLILTTSRESMFAVIGTLNYRTQ